MRIWILGGIGVIGQESPIPFRNTSIIGLIIGNLITENLFLLLEVLDLQTIAVDYFLRRKISEES